MTAEEALAALRASYSRLYEQQAASERELHSLRVELGRNQQLIASIRNQIRDHESFHENKRS